MKLFYSLILFSSLLMVSCSGETSAYYQHVSPNGKVKVNVEGHRATAIESWKVDMKVNAYDFKEGKLSFEIYAKNLNKDNITFTWSDERNCIITIKQQDNSDRKFQLIASAEQLQLGEVQ